jgi:hypothetical protein
MPAGVIAARPAGDAGLDGGARYALRVRRFRVGAMIFADDWDMFQR